MVIMRTIYPALSLVILLAACSDAENTPAAAVPSSALTVWKKDSQLWANTASGEKQLLAADGQDYDAVVSADGRWLVVDVVMFSDLRITRLLERTESGSYEFSRNLSRQAWQSLGKQRAIDIEDLIHPRTRFVGWSTDGKSVTVEASANSAEGDDILETLTINLVRD